MGKIKSVVLVWLLLFGLWVLLTSLASEELIVGAVLSLLIALFFHRFTRYFEAVKLTPKSIVFMPYYLVVFIIEMIKSNIDVALRVINPALPIHPGIVEVKTNLKSELGRLVLANSITLTPGTLTVDVKNDKLFIHWIDVKSANSIEATKHIVSHFDKILVEIFK